MKTKTTNSLEQANGTCLQGYCPQGTTYQQLEDLFGEPIQTPEYCKSDAEWVIEFDDGEIATIYNYKNGINYLGDNGTPTEAITDWNIGANKSEVAQRIIDMINNEPFDLHTEWQNNQ